MNRTTLSILLSLTTLALLFGGCSLKEPEEDVETVEVTPKEQTEEVAQEEQATDDVVREGWNEYLSEKYLLSFSYPDTFTVVKDENTFDDLWEAIRLSNPDIPEQPMFSIDINHPGRGMMGSDIGYELEETPELGIRIVDTFTTADALPEEVAQETVNDNTMIIGAVLDASDGNQYLFWHSFNEGGMDFKPIFDEMMSTIFLGSLEM